ncbi:putative conserved mid region of cactin containing protein [Lyophyllum shimeji]|uniref:Splicing factor Cactin n=1 Tax=Lyophyllum shimeji TaxID=47721 RepID=A0A9P3UJN2_LYOSH|nr:putative conserved mid region of cactin containing protein [Lyophyllum shimeji]
MSAIHKTKHLLVIVKFSVLVLVRLLSSPWVGGLAPRRLVEDKYSSTDDRDHSRRRRRDSRSRSRDREKDSLRRKRDRSRSSSAERKEKKRKREKSEERRARKAEKKRIKEEEEARQVAELSIYSATDNPFHDVNLGQQFRWHKKNEKERKQGLSLAEAQRRDAIRRQEAKVELERLNRRRAEREVEQRLREEEELRMQRLQESAQVSEWLSKEGDFQLVQERRRAAIRIKEKRAKAIDFLALNLKYVNPSADEDENEEDDDAGLEIDLDEPYNILDNLTMEEVEELHDDIDRYLSLEESEVNLDFWTNMMVVCKDRLEFLKTSRRTGQEVTAAVEADITALLSGKTYEELVSLQRQVQSKLTSGEPVDTDYWEGLLKKLLVWKAKAKLKSLHEVVVRNRLEQLRKRQRDEALQAQAELLAGVARSASKKWDNEVAPAIEAPEQEIVPAEEMEEYDRAMSPPLLDITKLPPEERDIDIVTEAEALRALLEQRRTVAASRFVPKAAQPQAEVQGEEAASNADLASEALYRAEAERDLDEEEELFNLEENIANPTTYNWEDKYRPRKPRYFNRVHTGYEWNKYNQTHYDTDNPPPKVVQGYKFNIFYPDLIDKSKAPTYKIVKEPGNDETVLLHFSAGPPYEDIAFRIVNREWEFSHKRGFRSSFDRGCLSLWFNFRRSFYRK